MEASSTGTSKSGGGSELKKIADEVSREARNTPVPIYIAVLAAFLALVSMSNDNASKLALRAHIEASNQFAFFQAKNIRATDSEIAAQMFAKLDHAEEAKVWGDKAKRYESEKSDILKAARGEQAKREVAMKRTGYFETAIALLQIAIVLATASLIVKSGLLISGSVLLTFIAVFFAVNGQGLYYDVPTDPVEIGRWVQGQVSALSAPSQ